MVYLSESCKILRFHSDVISSPTYYRGLVRGMAVIQCTTPNTFLAYPYTHTAAILRIDTDRQSGDSDKVLLGRMMGQVAKQMMIQESNHTALRPEKTLLYSSAATYDEYAAASIRQDFLRIRQREIRIMPEEQAYFTAYPDPVHWLVVVADDSPDSLVALPVLDHVAKCVPSLTLRVVREDEASKLLASLVDDAGLLASWAEADLPLLISFDEEWHFQEQWGPHPQAIEPFLDKWVANHPDHERLAEDESPAGQVAYSALLEQLLQELRLWYNSSLNQACAAELRTLLAHWHDESGDEE